MPARKNASRLHARLLSDTSGVAAVLFGLMLLPTVGLVGAAVDYSRVNGAMSTVQASLDAAALAGASNLGRLSHAQIRTLVTEHASANLPPELRSIVLDIRILDNDTTVRVAGDFTLQSRFIQIIGIDALPGSVMAEARRAWESAEIALALDVTGTMRNHIPALQTATREFIDIVQPSRSTNENVRISLVPYVAAVNVSGHRDHMAWMDSRAEARFHGENFENFPIGDRRCDPPPPPPRPVEARAASSNAAERASNPAPAAQAAQQAHDNTASNTSSNASNNAEPEPPRPPPPPAPVRRRSPDLGFVAPDLITPQDAAPSLLATLSGDALDAAAGALAAIVSAVAPGEANAQGAWPYGTIQENSPMDCTRRTPAVVNHFDLFNAMGVRWGGCVEARPYPRDVEEGRPRTGEPDSLFVPFLWPDEHDDTNHFDVRNNYLPDGDFPSWAKMNDHLRQAWVWKYDAGVTPDVDTASFLTRGPNAACPTPLTPLTSNRADLISAIAGLRSFAASGTNIAEGFAWAWRMISPNFLPGEAQPYDPMNRKYIIVMTDGFNEIVPQDGWGVPQRDVTWNDSDYSAIGYAARKRLGTDDVETITQRLDERLAEVCRNANAAGVRVFTVLFDPVGHTASSDVQRLLGDCASRRDYVFNAATSGDLVRAFRTIGQEINALRLSR